MLSYETLFPPRREAPLLSTSASLLTIYKIQVARLFCYPAYLGILVSRATRNYLVHDTEVLCVLHVV